MPKNWRSSGRTTCLSGFQSLAERGISEKIVVDTSTGNPLQTFLPARHDTARNFTSR
jgi:hypothetical protein